MSSTSLRVCLSSLKTSFASCLSRYLYIRFSIPISVNKRVLLYHQDPDQRIGAEQNKEGYAELRVSCLRFRLHLWLNEYLTLVLCTYWSTDERTIRSLKTSTGKASLARSLHLFRRSSSCLNRSWWV